MLCHSQPGLAREIQHFIGLTAIQMFDICKPRDKNFKNELKYQQKFYEYCFYVRNEAENGNCVDLLSELSWHLSVKNYISCEIQQCDSNENYKQSFLKLK